MAISDEHYKKDCFYFNGLKPCFPHYVCSGCTTYKKIEEKILYIHTGAMGDIIRQMSLLRQILETNPQSQVTICTAKKAVILFSAVKEDYSHQVLFMPLDSTSPFYWEQIQFDRLYNLDRDLASSALASKVSAKKKFGFSLESNGVLGYFNEEAKLVYELGLNDKVKFYENKLYADQYMAYSMGLCEKAENFNQPYGFKLTKEAQARVEELKKEFHQDHDFVLGVNVGVGPTIPFKNLSERAIKQILLKTFPESIAHKKIKILLLGGEAERKVVGNIKQHLDLEWEGRKDISVLESFSTNMIEGAQIIGALDLILTSDTFALHLALSQDVPNLSWFGPTNAEEIRFSKSSIMVQSDFNCAPCWKNHCELSHKCNDDDRLISELSQRIVNYIKS